MKNQTDMEHDVFISYSRKDEELVKKDQSCIDASEYILLDR